jgi:pyruvate-formate lyase-activating enzyme
MRTGPAHPYVLYSTTSGEVGENTRLTALDLSGEPLSPTELIPLPEGATLAMLPDRLAAGLDSDGNRRIMPATRGWAMAALLPIGYTRLRLPAYETTESTSSLPFFGYTAIAGYRGRICVAARRTDKPERWLSRQFDPVRLERLVKARLDAEPESRILRQHAHCALDYQCPTASNLFFGRWEGAIAVSAGCNARCIGCISKQEEEQLVSPQDRLMFRPTVEEVVEVATRHLNTSPDAIISFGQGCEGEPLLQARLIEKSIEAIRQRTSSGVININTNASSPRALARLYAAGLDMLRASTISARPDTYAAYYRPIGYSLQEVKQSLRLARDAGVFSSINLLCYPGLTDAESEVTALLEFLRETEVRMVQLRNLTIDPEVLRDRMPPQFRPGSPALGPLLGMHTLIKMLHHEMPDLVVGNFSRAVRRQVDASRAAGAGDAPAIEPAPLEAR